MIELKPSVDVWRYFKERITLDLILSSLADRMSDTYISYSATTLLKDLNLLTPKGKVNKLGRKILSKQLHERYHNSRDGVIIVNPLER